MLSITFQSGTVRNWHVGEPICVEYDEVRAIAEIQADGHELEYIENQYSGQVAAMTTKVYSIPRPNNKRVIRWFGDIAQTIVGNL
jgi:hypothetical protein